MKILQAKAEYEGQAIHPSLRVSWYGNGNSNSGVSDVKDIYYDMTDGKGHFVKILKEEDWELVNQTPIHYS